MVINKSIRKTLLLGGIAMLSHVAMAEKKPNILFIAIDDMNDWVGVLGGQKQAKTPNIDKLAKSGINFTNAHCSAPGCSPSRNAILYGIEPYRSGMYAFYHEANMKPTLEKYTSLIRLFKENGYDTYGSGKIHHDNYGGKAFLQGDRSEFTENNEGELEKLPRLKLDKTVGFTEKGGGEMSFCPTTSPLEDHPDYVTAQFGVEILNRKHDKPFSLAVGFHKPHLPFICPKEESPFVLPGIIPGMVLKKMIDADRPDKTGVRQNSGLREKRLYFCKSTKNTNKYNL